MKSGGRWTRLCGRHVAIKILSSQYSRDPDRLRRFEQEARAAGMLNHPNVLAIYAVGKQEDSPYLVTELLEGATLRQRLAERRRSRRAKRSNTAIRSFRASRPRMKRASCTGI